MGNQRMCRVCNESKDDDGYYGRYDKECRACRQAREREQYAALSAEAKAERRARNRAYRQTPAYRAARAQSRAKRRADPEQANAHRVYAAAYHRKRRQADPVHRIGQALRCSVYGGVVRYRRGIKSGRTQELLGCSFEQLAKHLESLWQPGMSWENYGAYRIGGSMTWHIDHIRPLASFDLTDPEQQKQCFHYTNLQPLWADENIAKSDRIGETI